MYIAVIFKWVESTILIQSENSFAQLKTLISTLFNKKASGTTIALQIIANTPYLNWILSLIQKVCNTQICVLVKGLKLVENI